MKHIGINTPYQREATIESVTILSRYGACRLSILVRELDSSNIASYETILIERTCKKLFKLFNISDIQQLQSRKVLIYWDAPCGSPMVVGLEPSKE